jgi:hypothetical protein
LSFFCRVHRFTNSDWYSVFGVTVAKVDNFEFIGVGCYGVFEVLWLFMLDVDIGDVWLGSTLVSF